MVSNVDINLLEKSLNKRHVIKSVLRDISKLVGIDLGAWGKMNVSSNTMKNINKIILWEQLEVENLAKKVEWGKEEIVRIKKILENTLHNNDILRSEMVNLKKDIKSLKLQIEEQQEEVLRLKTEFTKTSNDNNPYNILKTREA